MPYKLSDAKVDLIKEMAKAGWNAHYISKVLGLSHTVVYRYFRKYRIPRRAYRKFSR